MSYDDLASPPAVPLGKRTPPRPGEVPLPASDEGLDLDPVATHSEEYERLVRRQLELLGDDAEREGLQKTPLRVANAMAWLTRGYGLTAEDVVIVPAFGTDVTTLARIKERGAQIAYCDPYIPAARRGRKHDLGLQSVPCTAVEFSKHDALIVSTPHSQFRDHSLYENAKLVIDTRNIVPSSAAAVVVRA